MQHGGRLSSSSAAAAAGSGLPRLPVVWHNEFRRRGYCFKSPVWAAAGFKPVILKKPYRQNEQRLLVMLDKVRHGNFDWGVQHMLQQELQRPLDESDGIKPTELFPTNRQVDQLNARSYSLLPGPELKTVCTDRCEPANAVTCDFMAQQLDKNTNAQHKLDLKPGAQVVLLWNLAVTSGLANGTRGVVEGFRGIREYLAQEGLPVSGDPGAQGPIDVGAGCNHNNCSCQAGHCHQHHHHYQQQQARCVGLCGYPNCPCGMDDWSNKMGPVLVRLPDAPEGVWINLPEPKSMPAFKKKHMQNAISWLNHTDTKELPYVKFSKPPRDANNPEIPHPHRIIGPQTWTHRRRVRQYRGQAPPIKVELSRTALPLRLAWALTVHRSQGMSISKLRVYLDKAFGAGMVYVALSRCVSLDGLQVVGRVKAPETDADVKLFYQYMDQIEAAE